MAGVGVWLVLCKHKLPRISVFTSVWSLGRIQWISFDLCGSFSTTWSQCHEIHFTVLNTHSNAVLHKLSGYLNRHVVWPLKPVWFWVSYVLKRLGLLPAFSCCCSWINDLYHTKCIQWDGTEIFIVLIMQRALLCDSVNNFEITDRTSNRPTWKSKPLLFGLNVLT